MSAIHKLTTMAVLAATVCVYACEGDPASTPERDAGSADKVDTSTNPAEPETTPGGEFQELTPNTEHESIVEVSMELGELPPGKEVYQCQVLGNPFGQDVDIVAFQGLSSYSHHHFLFTGKDFMDKADPYPCQEIPPAMPFAFMSQGNHVDHVFPSGLAMRIKSGEGLMLQGHYLNTTDKPVRPSAKVRMYLGKKDKIKEHMGIFFMMMGPGAIPTVPPFTTAGRPMKFPAQSCDVEGYKGQNLNIMWMVGHMHSKGVHMLSNVAGQKAYETYQWDDPPLDVHIPAINVPTGTPVSWTCDYKNDTAKPIMFGDTAGDAMCAIFGGYYPADPDNSTQLCFRNDLSAGVPQ